MKKEILFLCLIFYASFSILFSKNDIEISSLSMSIEELKNQINDININAAVLNSNNNLVLVGSKHIWIMDKEDFLEERDSTVYGEPLDTYYISVISLSGKIISPWKKFFETTNFITIGMPLDVQPDKNGNTYLFWRYGQWCGPGGGYLRFTMFDREGKVKIDTFKVDNEGKFDTLNIGCHNLKKVDEKGNLHLLAPRQYVLINTQKGMPEVTEKYHFRNISLPKSEWTCFPVMGKSSDFYPLSEKRLFISSYSGAYEELVEMYNDPKIASSGISGRLSDIKPISAYKKENFTSTIINLNTRKYENPNIINIQEYSTRKYVGLNLPDNFRLQGAGYIKNGLLCLIKLGDKFLLNLIKKNEIGEIGLYQIFFDEEGNPIKPEHTEKVAKPGKFEDLQKDSQKFAKIIEYYDDSVRKSKLILFGFDKDGKYYQTNIDLGIRR